MIPAVAFHVTAGVAAIGAGWFALAARKGGRSHRLAGTTFCLAMMAMALVGGGLAVTLPRAPWTNVTATVITLYLVATSWVSVRRPAGPIGRFETLAVIAPLGIVAVAVALAIATFGRAEAAGYSAVFGFAALALLAAVCDIGMIRRGRIDGRDRVARHLWRMGLALVIALAAVFLGQQKVFPEALRGGPVLVAPVLATLAFVLFWLVRTRRVLA